MRNVICLNNQLKYVIHEFELFNSRNVSIGSNKSTLHIVQKENKIK